MEFRTDKYLLRIISESAYSPKSADNVRRYDNEYLLDRSNPASNCYGITCTPGERSSVILAGGGASAVTEHSAILRDSCAWIVIGDEVVCLTMPSLNLLWHKKVDDATCFEIFLTPDGSSLLVHGEINISRLTFEGENVWSSAGKDIFTGDFVIHSDHIIATDFNDEKYRVDISTGVTNLIKV